MSTSRTFARTQDLVIARRNRADHIGIVAPLRTAALLVCELLCGAGVISFSIMHLFSAAPAPWSPALSAALVLLVLGALSGIAAHFSTVRFGDSKALQSLRVFEIVYKGKSILLLKRPGEASGGDLPGIGTEAWQALTHRRAELIRREIAEVLEPAEREELDELDRLCGSAVERAYPMIGVDLNHILLLRDELSPDRSHLDR
ncbi:MAG: hypothetical protein U0835_10505 [Isosphaeraceae bacterium]